MFPLNIALDSPHRPELSLIKEELGGPVGGG